MAGDQATRKPTLEGRKGATSTPALSSTPVQAPSEPSRAQDPPPSASTVTAAPIRRAPSGVANSAAPPRQPVQRQRVRKLAPRASSRRVQVRSRPDAFISRGNIRPELPVKTLTPSVAAQAATSGGPKPARSGASQSPPRV